MNAWMIWDKHGTYATNKTQSYQQMTTEVMKKEKKGEKTREASQADSRSNSNEQKNTRGRVSW